MSNIDILSSGIKQIYETRGAEAFEKPKLFHALLNDLVPSLINERKVLQTVLDNDLLNELCLMFIDGNNINHQIF